jgi:response regulator RpfG family c-di-GMP phosphodiesterase
MPAFLYQSPMIFCIFGLLTIMIDGQLVTNGLKCIDLPMVSEYSGNNQLKKIILIDDDDIYLMVSQKILHTIDSSLEIVCFNNTRDVLNHFKNTDQHINTRSILMLLDINMPIQDGWSFLDELFETVTSAKNAKIYIVTSSVDNRDLEKVEQDKRISGMISKPVSLSTYKELIESL